MPTKQEILDEIKRTARENEGKPLGTALFEKETGIRPYDWEQYWPRFGDAQREAGFEPNTLRGALSDDHLIEQLIELIRKLGRFPTTRDFLVERRQNSAFPSRGAIQRRGGQGELAKRVTAYCETHQRFSDVTALCRPVVEGSVPDASVDRDEALELGEVYLFKSGRYYKIGRTNDTVRRGKEIRVQLPEKVTLIHTIKTDDPPGIEAYWHRRFEAKRMNGEWFDLNAADIRAFKRWRRIA